MKILKEFEFTESLYRIKELI